MIVRGNRSEKGAPGSLTLPVNETGRLVQPATLSVSLLKRLEAEDLRQDRVMHAIGAVGIDAILIPAVVAILIAATESLAKVVVVIVPLYVVAVVAVVRILIGIRASVVGTPVVLAVCRSCLEALLVTVVHSLAEQICAVLIRLVVAAAPMVTIDRRRVEVGIVIVIGVTVVLEKYLLLTLALQIVLLKAVLRHTLLLLQLCCLLLQDTLLLIQMLTVLRQALLLLLNKLLLTLL